MSYIDFYASTAVVLPVLLIALVVGRDRVLSSTDRTRHQFYRGMAVLSLALFLVGEVVSFTGLLAVPPTWMRYLDLVCVFTNVGMAVGALGWTIVREDTPPVTKIQASVQNPEQPDGVKS